MSKSGTAEIALSYLITTLLLNEGKKEATVTKKEFTENANKYKLLFKCVEDHSIKVKLVERE